MSISINKLHKSIHIKDNFKVRMKYATKFRKED